MRTLVLSVSLAIWAVNAAGGSLQSVWTNVYDSPRIDAPVALARDSQKNVAVLISSDGEVALVKYSAAGTAWWTNRFDSPLQDMPGRLAVAPDDSLLVTVVSTTNSLRGGVSLLKYSAAGGLVWSRTGDVTDAESPPAVATDAGGNAFVAAITTSGYAVLKYDAGGTLQWTNWYPVPSGYYATTKEFAVDAAGNVVLVAALSHLGSDRVVILRCSPSGVPTSTIQEWPRPGDFLAAASLDAAGNVYLAASVQPAGLSAYHLFTARYGPDGALIWSRLRPPASGFHHAVSQHLALDSAGNLLVTAYETYPESEDDDVYQTLTLKYSGLGDPMWSSRAPGFDRRPTGLAVEGGNIHVVSGDSVGQSTLLVTYRADGSQAAEATVPGHSPGQIVASAPGEFCVSFSNGAATRRFALLESVLPLSATIAPPSAEVVPGATVTFTAVVSGVGPFRYDWRYLGYRVGVTKATLTITNAQYQWGSHGDYTVTVSNDLDYTVSPEARLTVFRAPTVRIAPLSQDVLAGQPVVIDAIVSGTEPFSYSWIFNGRPVVGVSNSRLVFPSVAPGDAGFYSVVVSNRAGLVASSVSKLQVVLPAKSFTNAGFIVIPTNGVASPYPSEIEVTGVTGRLAKVTAALRQWTCSNPGDLAVLLQSPDGTGLLLMADDANDSTADEVTMVFDDDAPGYVPDEALVNGTFKPTRHSAPEFPHPALSGPRVNAFADFAGHELNGVWRLFVLDQYGWPLDETPGQLAGGWALTFLESEPAAVISTGFRRITRSGDEVELVWDGFPGWRLQRCASLGVPQWTDVPGTAGAGQARLRMDGTNQFFRLIK